MPELRRDDLTGRWVIVSEERAGRPDEYAAGRRRATASAADCPFCEGREDRTRPEVLALRPPGSRPDGPGWRVRVFPNRYPALRSDAVAAVPSGGLPGFGVHEVVVDTPRHVVSVPELTATEVRDLLGVWRTRLRAISLDVRLAHALVFKNVGGEAGSSIEHAHTQIVATPVLPPAVAAELDHAAASPRCAGCEAAGGRSPRTVVESGRFLAEVPWAARFPYEIRIFPKRHEARFEAAEDGELDELAPLLRDLVGRVERAADRPAYHVVLHTAPLRSGPLERCHWRLEILPRTTGLGGYEWATGMHINPLSPEAGARALREVPA